MGMAALIHPSFSLRLSKVSAHVVLLYLLLLNDITRVESEELNSTSQSVNEAGNPDDLPTQANRPHILFIMIDDLGFNDVSYHGSEIWTPNIDKLAINGVRLENYYVAPRCGPSRAQFLSGRYSFRTGTQHSNFFPCKPYGLPLEYPTLAQEMRKLGYTNHMIGKWHLGFHTYEHLPTRRGFDTFRGILTGSGDHYTHRTKYGASEALDFYEGETPINSTYGYYSTHLYTRRARSIIRNYNKTTQGPQFMFLSYQAPHGPLQVPEIYEAPYSFIPNSARRTFAGMVSAIDEGIGQLVEELKNAGVYNNTVIIVSTDNGGQQKKGSSNYPFRGNKDSLYEGGVKGVGFISGPIIERNGGIVDDLVHITDWMPTIIHLANGNVSHLDIDGVNQWSTINNGGPAAREEIVLNIDELSKTSHPNSQSKFFNTNIQAAIRWKNWKLLTGDPGVSLWIPDPKENYNLYERMADEISPKESSNTSETVFLYNIRLDPSERFNLAQLRPDLVSGMLEKLASYFNSSVPAQDPKQDERCNPKLHGGVWKPYMDKTKTTGKKNVTKPPVKQHRVSQIPSEKDVLPDFLRVRRVDIKEGDDRRPSRRKQMSQDNHMDNQRIID